MSKKGNLEALPGGYNLKKQKTDRISGAGLEFIKDLKEEMKKEQKYRAPENTRVGWFGIKDGNTERDVQYIYYWVYNGFRKKESRRPEPKEPMSRYAKSLLEGTFKNW